MPFLTLFYTNKIFSYGTVMIKNERFLNIAVKQQATHMNHLSIFLNKTSASTALLHMRNF